jgi:hypothetical protein
MGDPEPEPAPFAAHRGVPMYEGQAGCSWAMALDGSKLSWTAFDFVTGLIQRRRTTATDRLSVMHISAPEQKQALVPGHLHPDKLQSDVNDKNIGHRLNVEWIEKQREPNESVGDTLVSMVHTMGPTPPNFLVAGSFGRKEKDSQHLGNVALATLKFCVADVFVVKSNLGVLPPPAQPAIWAVGTDNSPCARHTLDTVLALMNPDDKLFIYYAAKYESFAKRVEVRTAH